MKTGLFGQQLSLMEELKAATFTAHVRLQSAPFFQALASCQLPLESYVGQLRALAIIHGVLEHALSNCLDERVASVWNADMCRVPALQRDLHYFEPRAVADLKEPIAAALEADQQIRLQSVEQPLMLLGALYVLEGSALGARVVGPLVSRALLLTGDEGLSYLSGDGAATSSRWRQFQQRMNALELSEQEREQMLQAAGGFLGQLETVFRALYPFQPESRTYTVTAINPEAGRHAVPADAREVEASLRASDLCWQRYPYYEQRYGERGFRFARSDAAWQATLCRFKPSQIVQQVRWLGRVLAGRGMPTLLLQAQLEILVNELAAALPDKKAEYEKLLLGAADLKALRSRYLGDGQLEALSRDFDLSVGPQWSTRLPHTGTLLGAAVADERGGHAGAVTSLRTWMVDGTRFPPEWIAAVHATLAQARRMAAEAAGTDPSTAAP